MFAVEVVNSPASVPCLKLAFLLLLGSLLLPKSLLFLAFLLLLGCHMLVSDCMVHGHFHGQQLSILICDISRKWPWWRPSGTAAWRSADSDHIIQYSQLSSHNHTVAVMAAMSTLGEGGGGGQRYVNLLYIPRVVGGKGPTQRYILPLVDKRERKNIIQRVAFLFLGNVMWPTQRKI